MFFNCAYWQFWCFTSSPRLSPTAVPAPILFAADGNCWQKELQRWDKVVSHLSAFQSRIAVWGKNRFKESVSCSFSRRCCLYHLWQSELSAAKTCPNCKDCKKKSFSPWINGYFFRMKHVSVLWRERITGLCLCSFSGWKKAGPGFSSDLPRFPVPRHFLF